jgi:hypothetical protein
LVFPRGIGMRMRAVTRPPAGPLRIFKDAQAATFLDRPNRFLVRCRLGGRTVKAFLPNPGRLRELLLPASPFMGIASWSIPGFGFSDCSCKSHLFGMRDNPLDDKAFHNLLAWYRMDRLATSS